MFILGTIFVGGEQACVLSPSTVDDITYVELKNGIYDDLYATSVVDDEPSDECPSNWDFDTILHAQFNDTTNAGNMDWNLSTVSHLLIKRKKVDEFDWMTLYVKEVNAVEDFEIEGVDRTNEAKTEYLYACVPSLYGLEGTYSTAEVYSDFNSIYIVENDGMWGTQITDGYLDTTRNFPNSTVVTIHNKYPTDINTCVANYDTGTCEGMWVSVSEENCELQMEDSDRVSYQRTIIDVLSDRKPKLLKHFDGRIYLVKIEDRITDSADMSYNIRKIGFSWTEIGDHLSSEDMYYAGLSDVTEEWW